MSESYDGKELRKFSRLDWRYPVEFTTVSLGEELPEMEWMQGQTENISVAGMRLDSVGLAETMVKYIKETEVSLMLRLNIPTTELPVKAVGEVVWYRVNDDGQLSLGLRFTNIAEQDLERILKYAQ